MAAIKQRARTPCINIVTDEMAAMFTVFHGFSYKAFLICDRCGEFIHAFMAAHRTLYHVYVPKFVQKEQLL